MNTALDLSRALYFEKLHSAQSEYKISVFADVIQAQALNPPKQEHHIKHCKCANGCKCNNNGMCECANQCTCHKANKQQLHGFSHSSRHAMIEFLAKVPDVPDLFVTLTYSDDVAMLGIDAQKYHLELFRKQLEYHYPNVRGMWRIEFVPRKSGYFRGRLVPHFHLLIWLPMGTPQARIDKILEGDGQLWRNAWHKITHSNDENHIAKYGCVVEPIKSRKHAYAYCSKYLAKENEENTEAGRRWGRIGKFDHPTELETELTEREYIHFKRLLNAYIKSDAIKRFKRQKLNIPYPQIPLSHYLKFPRFFARMNVQTGCSVFGLGYLSQDTLIGMRTYLKIIRHARELAHDERYDNNKVDTLGIRR